jgi:hypothetical protein
MLAAPKYQQTPGPGATPQLQHLNVLNQTMQPQGVDTIGVRSTNTFLDKHK